MIAVVGFPEFVPPFSGPDKMWGKFVLAVALLIGVFKESNGSVHEWNYESSHGPKSWLDEFPHCHGTRQSPINIKTNDVVHQQYEEFTFENYAVVPTATKAVNNGHTVKFTFDTDAIPSIEGGGLDGNYKFMQFHFHWGNDSTHGSEHTINGVHYPLEMHVMHYKASYVDPAEAMKHGDGLMVFSILFQISESDNAAFAYIIESLAHVEGATNEYTLSTSYSLDAYFQNERNKFFRYRGSATTPPCDEIVIWTIFHEFQSISENQLKEFRRLLDPDLHSVDHNYRPAQDINGRKIYSTSESELLYSRATSKRRHRKRY